VIIIVWIWTRVETQILTLEQQWTTTEKHLVLTIDHLNLSNSLTSNNKSRKSGLKVSCYNAQTQASQSTNTYAEFVFLKKRKTTHLYHHVHVQVVWSLYTWVVLRNGLKGRSTWRRHLLLIAIFGRILNVRFVKLSIRKALNLKMARVLVY
jgi:hypothetical protein